MPAAAAQLKTPSGPAGPGVRPPPHDLQHRPWFPGTWDRDSVWENGLRSPGALSGSQGRRLGSP